MLCGMSRTEQTTRTPQKRIAKLKHWAQRRGVPYTTTREAGLRGEFPLIRLGRGNRALFAEETDLEAWINARKQKGAA